MHVGLKIYSVHKHTRKRQFIRPIIFIIILKSVLYKYCMSISVILRYGNRVPSGGPLYKPSNSIKLRLFSSQVTLNF
jgi:hypothetical protein